MLTNCQTRQKNNHNTEFQVITAQNKPEKQHFTLHNMNSATLKVPNQLPQQPERKMSDSGIDRSSSKSSLGSINGSIGSSFYTNDSRSLSRDSSFSSYSTTSTTGSSSCGDLDLPLRRFIQSGPSSRQRFFVQRQSAEEDRPCSRLYDYRRRYYGISREGSFDGPNIYKASSLEGLPSRNATSERSSSEPLVSISSPRGLIITTPPTRRAAERRSRSKSESYDDEKDKNTQNGRKKESKTKKKEKVKRSATTSFDWCMDEAVMRRVMAVLEDNKDQERDSALSERDDALRDCELLKCEMNALKLERDNVRQERDDLKRELSNRSHVIDHLKEHLGMANIPINSPPNSPQTKSTFSLDVPKSTRPRSKSEIRAPQFFVPDETFQRGNAYTRL